MQYVNIYSHFSRVNPDAVREDGAVSDFRS